MLLNPRSVAAVENIDVETLLPFKESHLWLSERDLYWGLPRSGLSFAPSDEMKTSSGIPYTFTEEMVHARIGLNGSVAPPFRKTCLMLNKDFWQLLEHYHNRSLFLHDCSRLDFLSALFPYPTRIVRCLEDFLEKDNRSLPERLTRQ